MASLALSGISSTNRILLGRLATAAAARARAPAPGAAAAFSLLFARCSSATCRVFICAGKEGGEGQGEDGCSACHNTIASPAAPSRVAPPCFKLCILTVQAGSREVWEEWSDGRLQPAGHQPSPAGGVAAACAPARLAGGQQPPAALSRPASPLGAAPAARACPLL